MPAFSRQSRVNAQWFFITIGFYN